MANVIIRSVLLGAAACCIELAASVMPVYTPPFKAEKSVKGEKITPVFDAQKKTFKFGSKELIFADNGTFKVMSSGKCVASGSFFMSTAFKTGQSNFNAKLKPGKYQGGTLYVESCKADAVGKSVIVEGKLPFHKPGTPVRLGSWKQTATLTADGKVDILLDIALPEGESTSRTQGFLLKFPGASGYICGKKPVFVSLSDKKRLCAYTGPALLPQYGSSADNCAWEFPKRKIEYLFWHRPGNAGIYIAPHPQFRICRYQVLFNPLTYGKEIKKLPGNIDIKASDALEVPVRGRRNLLLNPYFGQRYAFYHSDARYYRSRCYVTSEDALFGKYSLKSTGHHGYLQLSPVPADPGYYTFSFYARGNGEVNALFFRSAFYPYDPRTSRSFRIDSKNWKRYSFTFRHPAADMISIWLSVTPGRRGGGFQESIPEKGYAVFMDGLQLEAGRKMTAFEAPPVTGAFLSKEECFFESGKAVRGKLELSTLLPMVKGTANVSVKNFFDRKVKDFKFSFETGNGRFSAQNIDFGVLPDGIYVMTVDYTLADGKNLREHFRFSVMPYLKDDYPTRKIFSPAYTGATMRYVKPDMFENFERHYQRLRYIGCGANCQPSKEHSPEVAKLQDKYKQLRIGAIGPVLVGAPQMRKTFPELKDKIRDGVTYYAFTDFFSYSNIKPVLADHILLDGWTKDARERFKKEIIKVVRRQPEYYCYGLGSEWSHHVKQRKEYPDMVMAFTEAVRSVYPQARIMAMGETDMGVREGTLRLDSFFTRMKKEFPDWKPDYVETHPYTKDITQLYPNFLAFKKMADKHFGRPNLSFTEGAHFAPYAFSAWDLPLIGWQPPHWRAGTLSYDLGWSEKLSASYFARYYLVFLTEFDRVTGACCSAENSRNFQLDISGVPRAFQKIPNTLGILFRDPKKYLGDFAPDREIRCFAWIDGENRPLAAIWSENLELNSGYGKAVDAVLGYEDLELIDLMGNRYSAKKGAFQITPFPVFLRGKKGDTANFIKALKKVSLSGAKNMPFQIADSITAEGKLELVFRNILPREVKGKVKVAGKEFKLDLPVLGSQRITTELEQQLSATSLRTVSVPLVCEADGKTYRRTFTTSAFICKPFTGDWKDVPVMRFPHGIHRFQRKIKEKCGYKGDFDATFQIAWEPKGLHLRVTVIDDILNSSDLNTYRWNYDVCQVYFDTRCSARAYGRTNYDEDDYEYGLMPSADGKRCDVWRAISVDMQLGLGTAAPLNNRIAKEIPAKFTRTADGYIYEAFFPESYLLPAKMQAGWNMGIGMFVADRDRGTMTKQGLFLNTQKGKYCYQSPHLWPLMVLGK